VRLLATSSSDLKRKRRGIKGDEDISINDDDDDDNENEVESKRKRKTKSPPSSTQNQKRGRRTTTRSIKNEQQEETITFPKDSVVYRLSKAAGRAHAAAGQRQQKEEALVQKELERQRQEEEQERRRLEAKRRQQKEQEARIQMEVERRRQEEEQQQRRLEIERRQQKEEEESRLLKETERRRQEEEQRQRRLEAERRQRKQEEEAIARERELRGETNMVCCLCCAYDANAILLEEETKVEPEPHTNKKVISLRAFTDNKLKVMPACNTETVEPDTEEINGPSRSEIRARRRAVRQSRKDRAAREKQVAKADERSRKQRMDRIFNR